MDERVVKHDVCLPQSPQASCGDQLRITRPGTHQVHFAGCGHAPQGSSVLSGGMICSVSTTPLPRLRFFTARALTWGRTPPASLGMKRTSVFTSNDNDVEKLCEFACDVGCLEEVADLLGDDTNHGVLRLVDRGEDVPDQLLGELAVLSDSTKRAIGTAERADASLDSLLHGFSKRVAKDTFGPTAFPLP